MRIFFNIIIIAFGLLVPFQIYVIMSSNRTKNQPYSVIRSEKKIEIRHYPSATMATIRSSARSYKDLGRSGFMKLAGYIFGGNSDKKQIPMTAPVHMDINDSLSSMSFVMPPEYNNGNVPTPNDDKISISTSQDEYVAAIRFGGFASDADIRKYTDQLVTALRAESISYYGNFRFLGYNPPYQLFGRKNEVIVSVNWHDK